MNGGTGRDNIRLIRLGFGGGILRDREELEANFRELPDITQESLSVQC